VPHERRGIRLGRCSNHRLVEVAHIDTGTVVHDQPRQRALPGLARSVDHDHPSVGECRSHPIVSMSRVEISDGGHSVK